MSGPANASIVPGKGRQYVWNGPNGPESFPSVTTMIGAVLAKPALPNWAAKMCGEYTRDHIDELAAIHRADPERIVHMVKGAPWVVRDAAADRGTLVHAIAESISLGQLPDVPEHTKGYLRAWRQWVDDFGIKFEATEATCYNRTIGYAGTFDGIVTSPTLGRIIIDYKTGKAVYDEVALQLAAYRHSEFIGLPDGSEVPMPEVEGAYAVHLMDGTYEMVPVRADRGEYEAFKYVANLWVWKAARDHIGRPIVAANGVQGQFV